MLRSLPHYLPTPFPDPYFPLPTLGHTLGAVLAFPRFTPAHVLPGAHSYNGSDYTQLTVRRWRSDRARALLNATIVLQTTAAHLLGPHLWEGCNGTQGRGGAPCSLVVLATCEGADCSALGIQVSAAFAWDRDGVVAMAPGGDELLALPTGFDEVAITPIQSSDVGTDVPKSAQAVLVLPFISDGTGTWITSYVAGSSVATKPNAATVPAMMNAARGRAEEDCARFTTVGHLYCPMRDVLAWNTVYTELLHVYTPVSRNWSPGTFVWDVFFAAMMMAAAGPEQLRPRDIA